MTTMITLTMEASYNGVGQSKAASFLVTVQLHHRRWNDVGEASPCVVVQQSPSPVAEAVDDRLQVVCPVSPAGAGALEDGYQ